jgi:riboflavin kinase/FMN adenylyltransferase
MHRVVLTFRQHPRSVLTRQHPGTLTTLRQRRERFAALDVTHLVLIDFSAQFSRLSGREFIDALLRAMSLRKLVVGVDFRCGRGRDTDIDELQRLLASAGVQVVVVPPVMVGGNTTGVVSSTRIRASVRAGEFAATREMMGEPFEVDLRGVAVVPVRTAPVRTVPDSRPVVDRRANRWRIATEQLEQILPQPGVYAASAAVAGGGMVASEVEVTPDGVRCELPGIPLALRFHRLVAAHRGEHPVTVDGVSVALRVQE